MQYGKCSYSSTRKQSFLDTRTDTGNADSFLRHRGEITGNWQLISQDRA